MSMKTKPRRYKTVIAAQRRLLQLKEQYPGGVFVIRPGNSGFDFDFRYVILIQKEIDGVKREIPCA